MMKHYLYISDAKVEMLYSQLDTSVLKKIAAELRVDLNFGIATVGTTLRQTQTEDTRYTKLQVLVEYLERAGEVGWIDAPKTYFKGSLLMDWGACYDYEEAVYFRGRTDRTALGLIGSRHHLIGSNALSIATRTPIVLYSPRAIIKALVSSSELAPSLPDEDFDKTVHQLLRFIENETGAVQPLEFLAVNYRFWKKETDQFNFLIGSPLYVALAN